ncbi:helix-turn-helix transcriptional regulator [Pseudomonas sp. PDM10]|uniref:winged helix-turn-helix transcriptional regulator n=1 Tax=Pseudomonas sp. PDM10 TaxID=2769269 RepID=UPI00177E2956|nr:helix-turn-helix domain-containing protein [Pseudomonas sp. PDM10]MBD9601087.1 helix-turn-helix transcriptional regulator [Pseudomonas sp. PDM10]
MTLTKMLPRLPIERTLGIISGRWKAVIIHVLLEGPKRTCEIETQITGISQKVLIQQLKALEQHGIVWRKTSLEEPQRVDYSLTPLGLSLEPLISSLQDWGQQHAQEQGDAHRLISCDAVVRSLDGQR